MDTVHKCRGLQLHVLAYGVADCSSLELHARAVVGGRFHKVPSISCLNHVFANIALNVQGCSGLTNAVADIVRNQISKHIENKLT